jgi:hypothetical protein
MAFMRAPTAASLLSRAWSTSEIADGLGHIMTDGRLEMIDSAEQLEDSYS